MQGPIVITGVGGSGTRLLADMIRACGFYLGSVLNEENDNLWFTLLFRRPPTFLPILLDHFDSGEITVALSVFAKAMAGNPLTISELAYVVDTYNQILNASSAVKWRLPQSSLEKARDSLHHIPPIDLTKYHGWGWKEPNSHLFLPYIDEKFPNLKVIYVLRHPLDMAYSPNQNQLYNWGSLFGIDVSGAIKQLSQASLDYCLRANQAAIDWGTTHLKQRFMVLNFDNLCTSPLVECQRILDFIEVNDIELNTLVRLIKTPESLGRYRTRGLQPFQMDSLNTVRKLGFTVETSQMTLLDKQTLLKDLLEKIDRHRAMMQKPEQKQYNLLMTMPVIGRYLRMLRRLRNFPTELNRQAALNKLLLQEMETLSLLLPLMKDSETSNTAPEQSIESTAINTYRSFVGPIEKYDLVAAMQFNLVTNLGLREHHSLLDIGCGSLRAGRLFIPYLLPGNYFGIEPNQWLIQDGITHEIGRDMVKIKQPAFDSNSDFKLSVFGRQFDYLIAQSIFSHAAPWQISVCFAEARKVMRESSIFVATFRQGETNYQGKEWVYPDGIDYTVSYIVALAQKEGLHCALIDWPHPNGQKWVKATLSN